MKIAYVVPRYVPHLGGVENHVAALATGAAAAHEVIVLTQAEGDDAIGDEYQNGVMVRRFRSHLSVQGQGISPDLWHAVRQIEASTDIVHVHNIQAVSTLGVLRRVRTPGLVVTPHYLGPGKGHLKSLLHKFYDPLSGCALRKAGLVICVNRVEAHGLARDLGLPASMIQVVPNGVHTDALWRVARAERSEPEVLVASRLVRYKRVDLVLSALVHLPSSYSLVIAGTGPERKALEQAAATLGVSERTQFLGQLAGDELARWYRRAAVVVSMSQRECYGMTIAEGLVAGCGVVASDIPAHREVIDEAGWYPQLLLAPSSSGPQLARAIEQAIALRAGFCPRLPSWDDVVSQTLQLYDQVLARPASLDGTARRTGR